MMASYDIHIQDITGFFGRSITLTEHDRQILRENGWTLWQLLVDLASPRKQELIQEYGFTRKNTESLLRYRINIQEIRDKLVRIRYPTEDAAGLVNEIRRLLEEQNPTTGLTLDEIFRGTYFPVLATPLTVTPRSVFSVTRTAHALMPTAVELWRDFSTNASRFRGVLESARYSLPDMDIDTQVSEERHVQDVWVRVDAGLAPIYRHEISKTMRIRGSANEKDLGFYVGDDLRTTGEIKCHWEMLANHHDPNDLIGIYEDQLENAKLLISRNESVPNDTNYAVFWAISQVFGFMVNNETKYGVLTTFNQNWYLKHEGDGKLFVSPTVYCNTQDNGTIKSLGLVRAQFYFLSLLLNPEAKIPRNLIHNLKLNCTDRVIDPESRQLLYPSSIVTPKTEPDSAEPTTSQDTGEREVDYAFHFKQLGPCIGKGATGWVRVYRDYFDGQVHYPAIAIKFIDIADSDKRYKEALNEVAIYQQLYDLQGDGIPELLFHCSMYPFYLIAMTLIEGEYFDRKAASTDVLRKLTDILDQIHGRGVVHNDFRSGNILVDKTGNPWIIDFAYSYLDTPENAKKVESVSSLMDAYRKEGDY